jgi:hypothetical protein
VGTVSHIVLVSAFDGQPVLYPGGDAVEDHGAFSGLLVSGQIVRRGMQVGAWGL